MTVGAERQVDGGAREGPVTAEATLARVAAWAPDVVVIVGSGMAALAARLTVDEEIDYGEIGWPATAVPGHDNRLRLARGRAAGGRELRLALACGRPHRYEGWADDDLERAVRDLATRGVTRLVATNACGGLGPAAAGAVVVCREVVDLQGPPVGADPPRLPVCTPAEAARVADRLCVVDAQTGDAAASRTGVYVAVSGPQYETSAEASWLARYGEAVGMSAAPELRAALATGMTCLVLALVVNRSGETVSHDDVLATAAALSDRLAGSLIPLVLTRWPELA